MITRLCWHSNMLFRFYASMRVQFWTRCEAVMCRIQTAWQRDWRLASRRHSSCLATALRSVPVNDRVWPSIVLWWKCVLQYFCWAWSWVGFGFALSNVFVGFPMTWENLRPKILARHDFSGDAGEASWDSFKSFIIPESPTGLAF